MLLSCTATCKEIAPHVYKCTLTNGNHNGEITLRISKDTIHVVESPVDRLAGIYNEKILKWQTNTITSRFSQFGHSEILEFWKFILESIPEFKNISKNIQSL